MNRIRELRKAMGWTQQMLADEIGTDQAHISQLETGQQHTCRVSTAISLAKVLGTTLDGLFWEEEGGKECQK